MTARLRSVHSSSFRLALVLLAVASGCVKVPDLTLTLRLDTGATTPSAAALAEARNTIQGRLGQLGVSPALVETAGADRITVRISREDDSERVRRVLLMSTVFELRFVRQPAAEGPRLASREEVLAHFDGRLPPDLEMLTEEVRGKTGATPGKKYYAVERQAVLTGWDIESARPGRGQFGEPIVEFSVKPGPASVFAEATGAHVGSLLAIVLDGRVISAPTINSRIGAQGVIEGAFTAEEAEDLAILLRSGPLPGRLTLLEERVEGGRR